VKIYKRSQTVLAVTVILIFPYLLVGPASGALLALKNSTFAECESTVTANVETQYVAQPVGTLSTTLEQTITEFVSGLCGGWKNSSISSSNKFALNSNSAMSPSTMSYASMTKINNFGISATGGGTIVNLTLQGWWNYNGSSAIGTSQFCQPTSTPFYGYSYAGTYCGWSYNGGSGYPNAYALERYLFTITLQIGPILLTQNYWYWMNAYVNGTSQFGCNQC